MRLVADIGGTNTRLAFVPPGSTSLEAIRIFCNTGFSSFEDVISEFIPDNVAQIEKLAVATAGQRSATPGVLRTSIGSSIGTLCLYDLAA